MGSDGNYLEPAAQWVTVAVVPAPAGIYHAWTDEENGNETMAIPIPAFLLQELREVSHYEGPRRVVDGIDHGRKPIYEPGPYETRVVAADLDEADADHVLDGPIKASNYIGAMHAPSVNWKPLKDL